MAAKRGAMKRLTGKLTGVRAARKRTQVGSLDRTLVVVESRELREGQKRGIAVALRKAKGELNKLDRLVQAKRISRSSLEQRVKKALAREHLSDFVVTEIAGTDKTPPSGGRWMRSGAGNWKRLGSAGECCARINICGARAALCMRSAVNGMLKNSFVGRRRERGTVRAVVSMG